ncbi:MAG: NYN domain-containing protein [Chloroflexi bacterium]|nr:NYN domain-containing protein [Chloroflexota bacterium]
MPNRVAIFIDGAYLDHVLREEFHDARIDYAAFSKQLAGESDILRTHYYHCLPYQGNPPTQEESERYAAQRSFYTALERNPRFTVRLGRLAYRGLDESGRPKFEQKRVDILLGVDLVQLAAKQAIQEAILVAGDSDFIPAVLAAKSEGVLMRLIHGATPHSDLWKTADERTQITQTFIDSVRRQPRLTPN